MLLTIAEIARLVMDSEDNIQGFIRDDRIVYLAAHDGILIPFGAFQVMMHELYDLRSDL